MKKILSATCAMMLASAGMMANAQQLPNVGFEDWKTACGETYGMDDNTGYRQRPGVEPKDWNGSSVNQKVLMSVSKELIKKGVAEDGSACAQLQNLFVGIPGIAGSTAPGYLTLGTPWVHAEFNVSNCDGGTFGGVGFTSKPDAIKGQFKRTDTNDENSYIIAYLWNGSFSSKIGSVDLKKSEDKSNVDRAILGDKLDPQKNPVTGDGKLVARCEYSFKSTNNEWQEIEVPLTYVEGAGDPTMMNVIISAGDYWTRGNLKENTTLLVDDVEFVYYSRLDSISFKGTPFDNLKENVYYYEVDAPLNFTKEDVVAKAKGKTGAVTDITVDTDNAQVKVTVSNNVGVDSDGEYFHTYTFQFLKPVVYEYDGYLNVEMLESTVVENTQSKIEIQDYQNGYCTFLLPNLIITIGETTLPLGDIRIDNVEIEKVEGGNSYTGTVEDMALLGGAIHAKVVLNGTIIGSDVKMDVDVIWYQDYPNNTPEMEMPIKVSFTSAPLSGVESVVGDGVKVYAAAGCVVVEGAEGVAQIYTADGKQVAAEAVNGKTEIALTNGLYIVRVGNKVQKVVVK